MIWWYRMDALVGQAVRRELRPDLALVLRCSLLCLCLAGAIGAVLQPGSAAVCLVFPLLVTSFFEGVSLGLVLCPLFMLVFWRGPVQAVDLFSFASLCLFGVLIAGITSGKYRELYAQKQKLMSRLEVAREVQRSLEPPPLSLLGPLRVSTHMDVCQDLGGDFVGLRTVADGGALILMGDVQGKGPQSALTAAYLEGVFHDCCLGGVVSPEVVLERIQDLLESKEDGRFVTALCVRCDASGRVFRLANAGHPLPIVLGEQPRMVGLPGLVLGLGDLFELGLSEVQLGPRERLLLLSDGYFEEEEISEALLGLLRGGNLDLARIVAWLDSHSGEPTDDRTAVLLDPTPPDWTRMEPRT